MCTSPVHTHEEPDPSTVGKLPDGLFVWYDNKPILVISAVHAQNPETAALFGERKEKI